MSKHHEKHSEKSSLDETSKVEKEETSAMENEQRSEHSCSSNATEKSTKASNDTNLSDKELLDDVKKKLLEVESKCKDWQDQYLRKAADFENYRKRMLREKQEAIDYANQNLLLDLVQVLDDFDRAIDAGSDCTNEAFTEGVVMIKNQMSSMLSSKYGLTYYPAKGEKFDPNIHEAISMLQSKDVSEPTIGEEIQKGYKLKDRVIRSSKVMVLMPAEKNTEDKSNSKENKTTANDEDKSFVANGK